MPNSLEKARQRILDLKKSGKMDEFHKMMVEVNKKMAEYVNITPTWEWAITIHLEVLTNPLAPDNIKADARREILRCAHILDQIIAEKESENADR